MEEKPKAMVVPAQPQSERMRQYFTEHKSEPWTNHLEFLLNTFPQVEGGRIQHLLYGGTAIKLLCPDRQDPTDVDTVTRSQHMAIELPPQHTAQLIDVHSIDDWLKEHQLPLNPVLIEFIFQQHEAVDFIGQKVLIMNPILLAWSKMNVFNGQVRRPKDIEDLKILDVERKSVDDLSSVLRGFK